MKQTIVIHTAEHRNLAKAVIDCLPLDVVHDVVIREHKRNRSMEQNRFYRAILTIIANELGMTPDALAKDYKGRFLSHIYERDVPEYAEMIETVREVWRSGAKAQAEKLNKHIVNMTSTTTATVPQMQEYLDCIIHHANSLAIKLPYLET